MDSFNKSNGTNKDLDEILDKVVSNSCVIDGKIVCPCENCKCVENVTKEVAMDHLKTVGFSKELMKWMSRWDTIRSQSRRPELVAEECEGCGSLFAFNDREREVDLGGKKYKKRLADSMVKLMKLKEKENLTDESVTELLKLCNKILPEGEEVANSYDELIQLVGKDDDNETTMERRSGQNASASTSVGEVAHYTKEEKRRKLREKINERKVSRVSRRHLKEWGYE